MKTRLAYRWIVQSHPPMTRAEDDNHCLLDPELVQNLIHFHQDLHAGNWNRTSRWRTILGISQVSRSRGSCIMLPRNCQGLA
jgi:hypothetical protein